MISSGILLLDKPQGLTSFSAMRRVQRLLGAQKAGHTGSLDPLATGMLPICLGEATKFAQWLLADHKTYLATGLLGVTTSTGDAWGEPLVHRDATHCTQAAIEAVLPAFRGEIEQIPPMYSALKYQGQPLYRLARKGKTVERMARRVCIQELSLLQSERASFSVRVHCSKGTYIRTLIEAIGEALGVGAHVTQLHRVSVEEFSGQSMFSIDALTALSEEARWQCVLPMACAVKSLPRVMVNLSQRDALYQGKVISEQQDTLAEALSLWDETGRFFGVGRWDNEIGGLRAKRLCQYTS